MRSDEEAAADAQRQELSTIKNPEEVISVVEGDENLDDEVVDSSLVWERSQGRVDGEQEGMSLNTEHEHANVQGKKGSLASWRCCRFHW